MDSFDKYVWHVCWRGNGVFQTSSVSDNWIYSLLNSQSISLLSYYSPVIADAAGNRYGTSEVGRDMAHRVCDCGYGK